jgi:formate-dependent nitrite reductase membrane component NrfD
LPALFLVGLLAWLVVLFAGFGLMTPRNPTAVAALLICGASIAGAIFLILELGQPFDGLLRASSRPFEQALARLRP